MKRETVDRVYRELLVRVKNIIENKNDYIMHINNLCIFGSYVNSDKPKIHDLDIVVDLILRPDLSSSGYQKAIEDYIKQVNEEGNYTNYSEAINHFRHEVFVKIRNNSKLISFHDTYDIRIALLNKHIWVVKDGVLIDNPVVEDGISKEEIIKKYGV